MDHPTAMDVLRSGSLDAEAQAKRKSALESGDAGQLVRAARLAEIADAGMTPLLWTEVARG
jgi:hypothetical protein